MKRSEAYHILGKLWGDCTPEQKEALNMAQRDLEFVDLMPDDMVAVVRCKDCIHYIPNAMGEKSCSNDSWNCEYLVPTDADDFCSYGKRKDD